MFFSFFTNQQSCQIERDEYKILIESEYLTLNNVEEFIESTLAQPYYKIIPEKVILFFLLEMCKLLSFLHQNEIYAQNMIHERNIFINQKTIKITDFGLDLITGIVLNEKTEIPKEENKFKRIKFDVKKIGFLMLKMMTLTKKDRLNVAEIHSFSEHMESNVLIKRLPKVYGKDLKDLLHKMISNKIEEIPYPEDIIDIKWNRNVILKFF
jgi:serine/threonine protein kinase